LGDIAQTTRIPLRHLDSIEQSNFSALPSFTYAIGFVRAYARAVGVDEVVLGRDLREELGRQGDASLTSAYDEVADPARVPPRWLAWTALAMLVLFAGGYGLWRSTLMEENLPSAAAPVRPVAAKPAPAAQPVLPTGPVVLTARDDVWFRIYDRNDKVLFEGVKKKGESYTVPDADSPMIRTGRADQIDVTLGGKPVPQLGPPLKTVKDVVLTVAALSGRNDPAAAAETPKGVTGQIVDAPAANGTSTNTIKTGAATQP
jgi:cytoskeletal protein RodZ